MILLRDLKLRPGEPEAALRALAAKRLRLPESAILELRPARRSLDARKKPELFWVWSVAVSVDRDEEKLLSRLRDKNILPYTEPTYEIPCLSAAPETRPVVAGFGPAGMFAALLLACAGARPIVLERGQDVETRQRAVAAFRAGGRLDPENNVQFGEGGAGTFSDGKLNTGAHDKRLFWVLRQFAAHGAPESVTYDAKPHIGTDVLVEVVRRIRQDVIAHGGEVRFGSRLERLVLDNGALRGVEVTGPEGAYTLPCRQLILAVGHSARDTAENLLEQGVPMEPKPFAMGVRIEHKQETVDLAQYGRSRGDDLPAADYSLHVHLPDGRGVFSFCMCPGGEVFAAASEPGGVATNGMSYAARDGENANAAVLVGLTPEDFPYPGPLGGMRWQRELERAAYACGGGDYRAPAQQVGDFLARRASMGPGAVSPSYRPGVLWTDLHGLLPEAITSALEQAIPLLGKKLRGFDAPEAVLTGPETRSSSPVRLPRGEDLCSPVAGLYPCGEGAGYAGGIASAAVDGLRCAEAVLGAIDAPARA